MMGALIATYLTATVEWVEAYTIVLAVALSIGWPRALGAAGSALLLLAVLTTIGSLILTMIHDLTILQFIIGVFLTLFGVRWLGKAIARGAGLKKLHDEDAEFAGLRARADIHEARAAWWIAFNGMLLEGLEVWLIVVALGVQTHHTVAASLAAAVALLVVCVAGILARKPLAKVPENTIKFTVGSGILSFGTYWVLESLGYQWPLGDASLLALFAFYALGGLALIRLYRFKSAASGVV
ncbi:MAG TPA: hypothetical protein PK231_02595 [Acidocella sp.]|jgi:uncharacterized membrane protein|nr:hypothetical protein [Acidocella sp.]OYV49948.1 MAG: hypothetical protein B7Z77_06870 [Acidocella sp. 20-58-15]OYY04138.1 MAG: hypothetical protein B7Y73_05035 [Acidocella sp. 35-58-6]HQT38287.1 hypothetical protein [Acidocella sp.]